MFDFKKSIFKNPFFGHPLNTYYVHVRLNIPVASSVTALEIWFLACIFIGIHR